MLFSDTQLPKKISKWFYYMMFWRHWPVTWQLLQTSCNHGFQNWFSKILKIFSWKTFLRQPLSPFVPSMRFCTTVTFDYYWRIKLLEAWGKINFTSFKLCKLIIADSVLPLLHTLHENILQTFVHFLNLEFVSTFEIWFKRSLVIWFLCH